MDNIKKLKRMAKLVAVLSKYGFETLVTETGVKKLIPKGYIEHSEKRKEIFSQSTYVRIRLALEELGPAYIKLGQLMSNRDDLLPHELTVELQKLQDHVAVEEMDIYAILKEELNAEPDELFEDIDTEPIAAASLAQVYTATLKESKQKVIIKAKRKGIREVIEADLLIMKDFAELLENYYEAACSIGASRIVNAYDKSITAELSFAQELANIERFRKNFANDQTIYVPITYKELSTGNILCMEFIDGIKISNRDELIANGLNTKTIAERSVTSYMKQVMEYGFFHADPHSGNIFILKDGRIAFIDYGSMGKLSPRDEEYIGDLVLCIIKKDIIRLLHVIKKIAVKYNIPDEDYFERELYDFVDIVDSNSVKELDLGNLFNRFSKLLNENKIVLPDYIYLLIRGIVLLEGIGRELGLETSIIEYITPYGLKLARKRLKPQYISQKVLEKIYNVGEKIGNLPEDISALIQKANNDQLAVKHEVKGLGEIKKAINLLVIAILIFALAIGSSILIHAKMPPLIGGVSVLGFIGFSGAGILAIILIFVIIVNRKI